MAYENADLQVYDWGQDATFGATTVTHLISGVQGKVGFVRDIECDVTTSLVGTTTVPEIQIGISSADATYGRYRLGPTASAGYPTGKFQASNEAITGNPPRTLADYTGHVVLDGGPLTSLGVAGGSYSTVFPSGRIPLSGRRVVGVVNGASSVCRVLFDPKYSVSDLPLNGTVTFIQAPAGSTGISANTNYKISAINNAGNWIELTGTTFGGTYTQGGIMNIVVWVTLLAGTGGSPAGGGYVRVRIQWVGVNTP